MKATELIWHAANATNPGGTVDLGSKDIDIPTMVGTLNRAIDKFVCAVAPYVDYDNKATLWINDLKCTEVKLKKKKSGAEFDRFELPEDYVNIITARVWAEKEVTYKGADGKQKTKICKAKFAANPIKGKSKDEARQTKYWRGNFSYRQAWLEFDKDGLKIYHDGDFKITKLKVSYVKCHEKIQAASLVRNEGGVGYIYADGTDVTADTNLCLGKGAYDEIIHIYSVLNGGDVNEVQLELLKKRYFETIRI